MNSTEFILLSLFTLVGGVVGSFGLNLLIQRTKLRVSVQRWPGWGLALFYVMVLTTVAGGLTIVVRRALSGDGNTALLESPLFFFTFGFLAGLPFTLPTVTGIWRETRAAKTRRSKNKPASRQERKAFVADLEKQMREYVDPKRPVHLELQGDNSDVLSLGNGFTRQEGERLVTALRGDFLEMGIMRVEGDASGNKWWVRVVKGAKK